MSRKQKVFFAFLILILIILCVLVIRTGLVVYRHWNTSLGPGLGFLPQSESPAAAQPTRETFCGGPEVMTILAIGSDYRADNYLYGLSDVMRVVRVDFVTPKVMAMEFPRDLYVEIPDIADHHGITHGKLNQAYLYGNPGFGYYDGPGQGPGLLARTLDLNFNMQPDHYLAINMQTFVKVVDAVDGIDVNLPNAVDGRNEEVGYSPTLYFEAGLNHLNGTQALLLARLRPNGVFQRAEQQNLVLYALRDKLLSPAIFTNLPDLVNAFSGSVQTDLSPKQISQLSCLAIQLNPENISFVSWPEEMFKGARVDDPILGRTFVWDVDFDLIRLYVAAFNNGQWLEAPPTQ